MICRVDANTKQLCLKSPQGIGQKVIKEFSKRIRVKETRYLCEFGGFRFDHGNNTLWRESTLIPLSPKSLELLKLLINRQGAIVSKQEIFDTVWADTFVEDGVLTQNIYTLRQALGKDEYGNQLIENVARRGYRLAVPIVSYGNHGSPLETDDKVLETWAGVKKQDTRKKPLFIGVAATVALLFVVLSFFTYRFFSTAPRDPVSTELRFTRLTDNGDASYLTISPDGNWVAYTLGDDLFIRDLRTDNETKLKAGDIGRIGCIQIAPDSSSIYFGTVFDRDEKGSIYRVDVPDGVPEPIAADVWSGFSVSPDGNEIAFVRKMPAENSQALIIRGLTNGVERKTASTKLPEEFYWNNYPAWSADGRKIALVAVNQTEHFSRILIVEDGKESEFRPTAFRNIEQVVWTADGNGFIASANEGENFQVWRIALSDGAVKRITNDLNSYLGIAVSLDRKQLVSRQRIYYSNIWVGKKDDLGNLRQLTDGTSRNDGLNGLVWLDEERLVYTSNDEKIRDWNLWSLNTTDGSRRKLTNDEDVQNDFPTASRDGEAIYFASDRSKERRIWRIDSDGGNPTQVTFGENEAHQFPQISPNGQHLYFIIKSGRTSNVGRASLTERSVQELSGKTKFVPGNLLALSPDGKHLAFQNIADLGNEGSSTKLQVAILSTEDPDSVRFVEFNAIRPWLIWSENGRSFDFVGGNVKETSIFRESFPSHTQPAPLAPMTRNAIFKFAWSPSGEKIAISRGQLLRDVVLLTDFGN